MKYKLRKGGHHGLNGEDNAASSMKRTTQRPRRRGGRLRPGRRAVATPDARRPRQCIHQTCRPALTDGKQAAVPAWEANNDASRTEHTCTQSFLLRTSGLGAPRAGRNLGRDGGSIGRTEILGRFLGYC